MDDPTQIVPKFLHKQINAYKISLTLVFIWLISYTLYQSLRDTNIDELFTLHIIELPTQSGNISQRVKCKEPCLTTTPAAITFSTLSMKFSINDFVLHQILNDNEIEEFEENINNKYNEDTELLLQAKSTAIDSILSLSKRRAEGSNFEMYTKQSLVQYDSDNAKLIFNLDHVKNLIETYDNWSDDNAIKERDVTLSLIFQYNQMKQSFINELKRNVKGFKPDISFSWLYHDNDLGWLIELVFWSVAGLLCNTVIMLNLALTSKQYSPAQFFLFIPQLFIAPILSVVILALVAGGITDSGIELANLSQFLIFSFLLGFNVENLTMVIREISNNLFRNMVNFKDRGKPQTPPDNQSDYREQEPTNIIDKYQRNAEINTSDSVTTILADEKSKTGKDV